MLTDMCNIASYVIQSDMFTIYHSLLNSFYYPPFFSSFASVLENIPVVTVSFSLVVFPS